MNSLGLDELAGPWIRVGVHWLIKAVMIGNLGVNVPFGQLGEDRMAMGACFEGC